MKTPVLTQRHRPGRLERSNCSLPLRGGEGWATYPVASIPDGIPDAL
jgi:hypothetical protein